MKKKIIILTALLFSTGISAQETLTLEQCREMALKYNKEMAASAKQTESARYTAKSYKGNFLPNFTLSGTGIYSTADGSLGIAGGNLPTFLRIGFPARCYGTVSAQQRLRLLPGSRHEL